MINLIYMMLLNMITYVSGQTILGNLTMAAFIGQIHLTPNLASIFQWPQLFISGEVSSPLL